MGTQTTAGPDIHGPGRILDLNLTASSAGNLIKGMENVEKVGTGWRKVAEAEA